MIDENADDIRVLRYYIAKWGREEAKEKQRRGEERKPIISDPKTRWGKWT